MNTSDWEAKIDEAKRKARELKDENPEIKVKADVADALAKLEALRAAQLRLGAAESRLSETRADDKASLSSLLGAQAGVIEQNLRSAAATTALRNTIRDMTTEQDRSAASAQKAASVMGGWQLAILAGVTAGTALIPIAAVLGAGIAYLGAIGVTAGLGILGLVNNVKIGTTLGNTFNDTMDSAHEKLNALANVAATGVVGGFTRALGSLDSLMPIVTKSTAALSTTLGTVAANVVPGLVAWFGRLTPLFVTFDNLLVSGSQHFEHWAQTSSSIPAFVAYAKQNLPAVGELFSSTGLMVAHLVEALSGLGTTTLGGLAMLVHLLSIVPASVMSNVLPPILGLIAGVRILQPLADNTALKLGALSTRMAEGGAVASGASKLVGGLGRAISFLGPIGIVAGVGLGIASVVMANHAEAARKDTERVDELASAMEQGKTPLQAYATLVHDKLTPSLTGLGVSTTTYSQALMGQSAAVGQMAQKLQEAKERAAALKAVMLAPASESGQNPNTQSGTQFTQAENAVKKLSGVLKTVQADYQKAKEQASNFALQQGNTALSAAVLNGSITKTAASLGLSVTDYYEAATAAKAATDQQTAQNNAWIIGNNAASLLNAELGMLRNQNLSLAQSQTAIDQATLELTKALKTNGNTVADNTAKGVANQQAIEAVISADIARAKAQTVGNTITVKGTQEYQRNRSALLQQIAALYGAGSATYRFAATNSALSFSMLTAADRSEILRQRVANLTRQINNIRQNRVPTLRANTLQAASAIYNLQSRINALQGKSVNINVTTTDTTNTIRNIGGTAYGGHLALMAEGGLVHGPGSGTSDSIPARLSNREYVMPADMTARYLPMLEAMRSGTVARPSSTGYAAGGMVGGGGDVHIHLDNRGAVQTHSDFTRLIVGALETYSGRGAILHVKTH